MITKKQILDWYCKSGTCLSPCKTYKCSEYKNLSALIDGLIKGVPCEKITFEDMPKLKQRQCFMRMGWNNHCDKVAEWKKKQEEGK